MILAIISFKQVLRCSVIMLLQESKGNCHHLHCIKSRTHLVRKHQKPMSNIPLELVVTTWRDFLSKISIKREMEIFQDQEGICQTRNSVKQDLTTQWLKNSAQMTEHWIRVKNCQVQVTMSIHKLLVWILPNPMSKLRASFPSVRPTTDFMYQQEKFLPQRQTYMNQKIT